MCLRPSHPCLPPIPSFESASAGFERDRAKIPVEHTWNLADLYPSDEAWKQAKETVADELPSLGQYRGRLHESARTLLDCLAASSDMARSLGRLHAYAS